MWDLSIKNLKKKFGDETVQHIEFKNDEISAANTQFSLDGTVEHD